MFESKCVVNKTSGKCENKCCLFPQTCKNLILGHNKQLELLKKVSALPNVKKVFISSGIRYDMICSDNKYGQKYLDYVVENNTSGQMKIAPERCDDKVLNLIGKPSAKVLMQFIEMFNKSNSKKQFLTYYFIAAYPGCGNKEMKNLQYFKRKVQKNINSCYHMNFIGSKALSPFFIVKCR